MHRVVRGLVALVALAACASHSTDASATYKGRPAVIVEPCASNPLAAVVNVPGLTSADVASSANRLPITGNALIQPGITGAMASEHVGAYVTELAPDGATVFEAYAHFAHASATASGWSQFDTSCRAHRVSL